MPSAPEMLCRKCRAGLEEMIIPDGIFGLPRHKLFTCPNKECDWFGIVVVAGIPAKSQDDAPLGGFEERF